MCNICNVHMPHAMGDVISSISIGIAAADSIGSRAPAWYPSNPILDTHFLFFLYLTLSYL